MTRSRKTSSPSEGSSHQAVNKALTSDKPGQKNRKRKAEAMEGPRKRARRTQIPIEDNSYQVVTDASTSDRPAPMSREREADETEGPTRKTRWTHSPSEKQSHQVVTEASTSDRPAPKTRKRKAEETEGPTKRRRVTQDHSVEQSSQAANEASTSIKPDEKSRKRTTERTEHASMHEVYEGMASTNSRRECKTEGCSKDAGLQCPTCLKLGIQGSYFCSQKCFKGSWAWHKLLHKKAKEDKNQNGSKNSVEEDINIDPWPGYRYTGQLRPHYPLTPMRPVPRHIQRPDYSDHPKGISKSEESEQNLKGTSQIKILSPEEIESMRVVCKLAREVLDVAATMVKPGVTTEEIDHAVHQACISRNCYPSPLNYYKFPKSCCTSVNEVICHGVPDRRQLQEGDILNVDITVYHRGFHGDLNETFFVGEVDEESKKLVQTTYECLMQAINSVKPGMSYRKLGNIIQKHAQANGFSVVRSYCGHGINRLFHTAPDVPHYANNKAVGVMKPGHVFTIEPMLCEGGWQDKTWPDNWTAVTKDGKRSAQFEHTLLVTETGCEILTSRLEDNGRAHFLNHM